MGSAFDPARVREILADDLDKELLKAQERAVGPLTNPGMWHYALMEVVQAHAVGLGDDPRCEGILDRTLAALEPLAATTPAEAAAIHPNSYVMAGAFETLALARWIRSDERQVALFERAGSIYRTHIVKQYGTKKKPILRDVDHWVTYATAAERFDAVLRILQHYLPDRAYPAGRAGSTIDFGHALALHHLQAIGSAADMQKLGASLLRAQVARCFEAGSGIEVARCMYLAQLGGLSGSSRELLGRATEFISYLAKPRAAKRRPLPKSVPEAPPARVFHHPLPTIEIRSSESSSSPRLTRHGMLMIAEPVWKQLTGEAGETRWAARIFDRFGPDPALDPRFADLHELATPSLQALTSPALTKLRRATLDGEALSVLARRGSECSVEVAFPRCVENWFERGYVQVSPELGKKVWADALAVGALTRLRALSIYAMESDKQRLARGERPCVIGPEWLWSSALALQLEAIDVQASIHDLAQWSDRFAALPRLSRVLLRFETREGFSDGWSRMLRVVLTRDEGTPRATLQFSDDPTRLVDTMTALFSQAATVSAIDFELLHHSLADDGELRTFLGRFGAVGEIRDGARPIEL